MNPFVVTESTVAATESRLVRAFGTWALGTSIVNVTVGGEIFRLPAAAQLLGPSALWAYVVCALAMGLVVLCFADAGSPVGFGRTALSQSALGRTFQNLLYPS